MSIILISLKALFFVILFFLQGCDTQDLWTIEKFDEESYGYCSNWECLIWYGPATSIIIDNHNIPHIIYVDSSWGIIKHAYKTSNGWLNEDIDSASAISSDISLDSDNNVHICYSEINKETIRYAFRDTTGWHTEIVDEGYILNTSIAVDLQDRVHIIFRTLNSDRESEIKYAFKDNSNWNFEIFDDSTTIGLYADIALNSQGTPHIVYSDNADNQIKHAFKKLSDWEIETIAEGVREYSKVVIDIDSENYPHIFYEDDDNDYSIIYYAYKDNVGWNTKLIENIAAHPAIDIDSKDRPHIVYVTDEGIKYGYRNSTGWYYENVIKGESIGFALDMDDKPHISCVTNIDNAFFYSHLYRK